MPAFNIIFSSPLHFPLLSKGVFSGIMTLTCTPDLQTIDLHIAKISGINPNRTNFLNLLLAFITHKFSSLCFSQSCNSFNQVITLDHTGIHF